MPKGLVVVTMGLCHGTNGLVPRMQKGHFYNQTGLDHEGGHIGL